jgi:hypothetical protein
MGARFPEKKKKRRDCSSLARMKTKRTILHHQLNCWTAAGGQEYRKLIFSFNPIVADISKLSEQAG